ncbi:unnamed protein product [Arabis nemorensis]|uniref:Uncharacterized protein n=1 Tax=Arabis nemorensis TaxID=586526 RepID=A0A565C0N1_9BRAS|nr:unnamed protein product [Arabis nemorensis]
MSKIKAEDIVEERIGGFVECLGLRLFESLEELFVTCIMGFQKRTGLIVIEYGDELPDSDDEDFREALRIESEQLSAERAKHLANITARDAVAYLTKQSGYLEEEHDELRSSGLRKYHKQSFAPLSPHRAPLKKKFIQW